MGHLLPTSRRRLWPMRIVRAAPDDSVAGGDLPPSYRVRFWFPPPAMNFAWLVDEWDITDAREVTDVIAWARSKAGGNPFEIFLRWEDHHTSKDDQPEPYSRYALIYGKPAVEDATTETISFESK